MRLLLDTHAWIWAQAEVERLSASARAAMQAAETTLYLSPISVYEALQLADKGRLQFGLAPDVWLSRAWAVLPVNVVPITVTIAAKARHLPGYTNPDPSDRFILATALTENLVVATRDESMHQWGGVAVLW